MKLPDKVKRKLPKTLEGQCIVIHGGPGSGKSTLASMWPDNYFMATEPGVDFLEIYPPLEIHNYKEFLEACALLANSNHKGHVTIDTYDKLVLMCTEYICARKVIEHPSDLGHGKGWSAVTYELNRVLTKLAGQFGLIIISHTQFEEIQTRTKKIHKATLNIGGKNKGLALDMGYYIFYIDSELDENKNERRIIRTDKSLYWDAKDKSDLLPAKVVYRKGVNMYDFMMKEYFKNEKEVVK